jgi:hypothetical protein
LTCAIIFNEDDAGVAEDKVHFQGLVNADVQGTKYLNKIFPLLGRLHHDGCARDKAHNRTLFYDQYVSLILLSMFSPAMQSLRAIQQASALKKVQALLGIDRRYSLGSLSEAARVFDPQLLAGVMAELSKELVPLVDCYDPSLAGLGRVTPADGTLLKALPRLAESMWSTSRSGSPRHGWRLHCQFDLSLGVAVDMELTDYRNSIESDERVVLKERLQSGRCYVLDRGYLAWRLLNAIALAQSDYVCRIKQTSVYSVAAERPVAEQAAAAGVTKDLIVRIADHDRAASRASHAVRLVYVEVLVWPRAVRGQLAGPPEKQVLILATNMLDVPAEIIALIYQYRWSIELFFRFFKQVLGCKHLLSDDPDGVRIQCYCALIACMLLAIWSGRKPNKATWRMVGWFISGLASDEELLAYLNAPDNTGVKLAQREERWRKMGL